MSVSPTHFTPISFHSMRDDTTPDLFHSEPPKFNRIQILKALCDRDFIDWNRPPNLVYKIRTSEGTVYYHPGIIRKK